MHFFTTFSGRHVGGRMGSFVHFYQALLRISGSFSHELARSGSIVSCDKSSPTPPTYGIRGWCKPGAARGLWGSWFPCVARTPNGSPIF